MVEPSTGAKNDDLVSAWLGKPINLTASISLKPGTKLVSSSSLMVLAANSVVVKFIVNVSGQFVEDTCPCQREIKLPLASFMDTPMTAPGFRDW